MKVQDVMTADVITVSPETTVHKAAELMSNHGVSGCPVVDVDGAVVGIVTEGDLIVRQAAPRPRGWWQRFVADPEALARDYQKASGTIVREVMTRTVVSVGPTLPLDAAARILCDRGVRRLPVVHGGRLVGILSRADVVKAIAKTPVTRVTLSDDELVAAMRARMDAEAWTPACILVEARDGVIELSGAATSDIERSALETMARAIPGCRDVENRVIVRIGLAHSYHV